MMMCSTLIDYNINYKCVPRDFQMMTWLGDNVSHEYAVVNIKQCLVIEKLFFRHFSICIYFSMLFMQLWDVHV